MFSGNPPVQSFAPNSWDPAISSTVNWLSPDFSATFDFVSFDTTAVHGLASVNQLTDPTQSFTDNDPMDFQPSSDVRSNTQSAEHCQVAGSPLEGQVRALYVDSDGSRLASNERSSGHIVQNQKALLSDVAESHLSEVRLPLPQPTFRSSTSAQLLEHTTYNAMREAFTSSCLEERSILQAYSAAHFPSSSRFEIFLLSYFENFHEIFPILHSPTFKCSEVNWILVLAVATVGSFYCSLLDGEAPLLAFLQRTLLFEVCTRHYSSPRDY